MEPECNISGIFVFFLGIARFFGIAPLNFTRDGKGWRIRVSPVISLFGYIYIILCTLTHLITMVIQNRGILHITNIQRVTWNIASLCDEVVTSFITSVIVYKASRKWRQLLPAIHNLQKVDSYLDITGRNTKPYRLMIVWVVFVFIICIIDIVIKYQANWAHINVWKHASLLLYFNYYWTIQLHTFLYNLFIIRIRCSFEAVNCRLRELLREIKDMELQNQVLLGRNSLYAANNSYIVDGDIGYMSTEFGKRYPPKIVGNVGIQSNHHKQVRRICHAYSSASLIVRVVNDCYGGTLMMVLSYIFFHLIVRNYYFFANILNNVNPVSDQDDPISLQRVLGGVLGGVWCLFCILTLITTIEPCHSTHMEMLETRHVVSQLLRCTHSIYEPLAIELTQFYNVLVIHRAQYKPMNVLVLSRDTTLTILGNISTYLTIMLNLK